jgi:hypothetical protein
MLPKWHAASTHILGVSLPSNSMDTVGFITSMTRIKDVPFSKTEPE